MLVSRAVVWEQLMEGETSSPSPISDCMHRLMSARTLQGVSTSDFHKAYSVKDKERMNSVLAKSPPSDGL